MDLVPDAVRPHPIGRIAKTNSHIEYLCRIFKEMEDTHTPSSRDFSFGQFLAIVLEDHRGGDLGHVIGLVFNTHIMDPDFGAPNRSQLDADDREVTLPTYMQPSFTMVEIMGIGWQDTDGTYHQTIPPYAPLINAEVRPLDDQAIRQFHMAGDGSLTIDYLTALVAHSHPLVGQLAMQQLQWLQETFPGHRDALAVIYNIVAWRSIVGVVR